MLAHLVFAGSRLLAVAGIAALLGLVAMAAMGETGWAIVLFFVAFHTLALAAILWFVSAFVLVRRYTGDAELTGGVGSDGDFDRRE